MYIHIKVTPNSKKEEINKIDESHFSIKVKEKAEQNFANKRILEIIREQVIGAKEIKIINGHHSPSKLLSVTVEGEE